MSAKATTARSSSTERVLEFLKTYRDPESGDCTPTLKAIAAGTNLTAANVRRIVASLVGDGTIEASATWDFYDDDGTTILRTLKRQKGFARGPNLYRVKALVLALLLSLSGQSSAFETPDPKLPLCDGDAATCSQPSHVSSRAVPRWLGKTTDGAGMLSEFKEANTWS